MQAPRLAAQKFRQRSLDGQPQMAAIGRIIGVIGPNRPQKPGFGLFGRHTRHSPGAATRSTGEPAPGQWLASTSSGLLAHGILFPVTHGRRWKRYGGRRRTARYPTPFVRDVAIGSRSGAAMARGQVIRPVEFSACRDITRQTMGCSDPTRVATLAKSQ